MKRKLIAIAILAVICFSVFDFFHISGREIKGVKDISDTCTVTIRVNERTPANGMQDAENHTLSPVQTEALKELLLSSSFRRSLAKTMIWQTEEGVTEYRYDILIDFNDGQRFISIGLTANRFISITDQFGGDFLIIGKNADFEKGLIRVFRSTI